MSVQGTIADNIAYGLNPDAPSALSSKRLESEKVKTAAELDSEAAHKRAELMEKVIAAAKLANAHDFIMSFPQGYDTDVGSNGVAMSGGQKQRIAIARALIKRPVVLLLDEATSALDATSERIVQQSIDALAQAKAQTTIIIAHRLSTIRNADKICVISDGRFVEMGKHEELLARNGIYADLVKIQLTSNGDHADAEVAEEESKKGDAVDGPAEAAVAVAGGESDKDALVTADSKKAGASGKKEEAVEISTSRAKELSRLIWGLIFRYPAWLVFGFCGAVLFGAVFPCKSTSVRWSCSSPSYRRSSASQAGVSCLRVPRTCFTSLILMRSALVLVSMPSTTSSLPVWHSCHQHASMVACSAWVRRCLCTCEVKCSRRSCVATLPSTTTRRTPRERC